MKEFSYYFYFYIYFIFININEILSNKNKGIRVKENINNTIKNNSSDSYYINKIEQYKTKNKENNNNKELCNIQSKCIKYLYDTCKTIIYII
jgi:hypothetical protein